VIRAPKELGSDPSGARSQSDPTTNIEVVALNQLGANHARVNGLSSEL